MERLVYKGKQERGQAMGETDRQELHALLQKAL